MRHVFALFAALCFALPAVAQQNGTVQFDAPVTGGAPAGYRLYRDSALVGSVTAGAAQTIADLFPANTGTWTFGLESHNAACGASPLPACARVNYVVTLGPPLQPPGPVINVTFDAPCLRALPPTCSINVAIAP